MYAWKSLPHTFDRCMYAFVLQCILFTSLQAEQYAVTATPTPQRKGPGGEVTTDEDIIGREEKGLLDEHLQVATAQTKFT